MNNTGRDHLEALSKSKAKMAEGQPNLQDWKIVDHTGQKVGTVYDLLFDTKAKKVRYIITNLNKGELLKQDRLVLVPVGRARYRESENEVVFPNITRDQLSALPDFLTVEHLKQEDEYFVRNAFRSEGEPKVTAGTQDWESFYEHEDFNEDVFYNRTGASRKETKSETTRIGDRKEKDDRKDPVGTSKNVKAGAGTDTLLTGSGSKNTSSEGNKKKDNDVNVHPRPEERSTDRTGSTNLKEEKRDISDTERRNRGKIKGDNGSK